MANGRNPGSKKRDISRDPGGFVALPWTVLDCPAYIALSHPARGLLVEFSRQIGRDNNGRLLASAAYLGPRGWTSNDVLTRSKRELLDAGFIFETVKGQRPHRASWYAVTWRALDQIPGYDAGTAAAFERGAYLKRGPEKIKVLRPSGGVERPSIAPSRGVETLSVAPPDGAIRPLFAVLSTPSGGDHLDMPSASKKFSSPSKVMA
jgi:hypothetical protein